MQQQATIGLNGHQSDLLQTELQGTNNLSVLQETQISEKRLSWCHGYLPRPPSTAFPSTPLDFNGAVPGSDTPLCPGAKSCIACIHAAVNNPLHTHIHRHHLSPKLCGTPGLANIRKVLQMQRYNKGSITPLIPKAVQRIQGKRLPFWGRRDGTH